MVEQSLTMQKVGHNLFWHQIEGFCNQENAGFQNIHEEDAIFIN